MAEPSLNDPNVSPEADSRDTLTAEQRENLEKGFDTDPKNPLEEALNDLNKEPAEEQEPVQEEETPPAEEPIDQSVKLPDGTEVTPEQMNNMLERARAMQVLESHPDILDRAIAEIKGHQGEVYEPQKGGEENSMSDTRLTNVENAIMKIANQLALQNATQAPDTPPDLQVEAQKILAEAPGLTVEQAVTFARDRISARSPAGNASPPVQTSERSGGATNSEGSSISEAISEAQNKIKAISSPDKAADTAILEALRIEQMKEEQQGGR